MFTCPLDKVNGVSVVTRFVPVTTGVAEVVEKDRVVAVVLNAASVYVEG